MSNSAMPEAPQGWGAGSAAGTPPEQLRNSSRFIIQKAQAFPCLDVLYPGKYRFHCQRCTDDAAISKFTRHRCYLFYGFTEATGEKLYRMPLSVANSYVEGCARGRIKPGACIRVEQGGVVVAGSALSYSEYGLQEHSDDQQALANAIVRDEFEIFGDGMQVYVLQHTRIPPYLVMVHEAVNPSTVDILAFENSYSREFIAKLDADYEENLRKSFRR